MSNGYYEKIRDDDKRILVQRSKNHTYPAHFHTHLEVFLLKHGHYLLTLNGTTHEMRDGDIAIIDSFDIHTYDRQASINDDCVIIIPHPMLHAFDKRRQGKQILEPLLHDPTLCTQLLKVADDYISPESSPEIREAGAHLFLSILYEHLCFTESKRSDERATVQKILAYCQEHFRDRVSRSELARALGYTEGHISRVFHRYLGKGLSEYLGELRLQYIEKLRRKGDQRTLTELIFEAGFGSQQTYYRVKKSHNGVKK